MTQKTVVVLPFAPESVREARAIVRDCGRRLDAAAVDDAELLVSEVVTNAVLHGEPDISLAVDADEASLTVSVTDGGEGHPAIPRVDSTLDDSSGRGLRMVQELAAAWGVEKRAQGRGKTVWFTISDRVDGHGRVGKQTQEVEGGTRWS